MNDLMDLDDYSSYIREEANHEIARLENVLRDPGATEQEREIGSRCLVSIEMQEYKKC